jgi:hypothetical protein
MSTSKANHIKQFQSKKYGDDLNDYTDDHARLGGQKWPQNYGELPFKRQYSKLA